MSVRLAGLHLAALWTIVFVQPLFDVLGDNAAFFVARGNTGGDVLILAFGWTLVPPLVATGALAVANRISERAFRVVHLGLLGALTTVLLVQVLKGPSPHAHVVVPLAALAAAGLVTVYTRAEPLRTFVSFLGVAPAVVIALFLVGSPVRDVVFTGDNADVRGTPATNPGPVVLLIFDELPTLSLLNHQGRIDKRHFPNFARLAEQSTWYPNATSVSDGTYVAVPAILTGQRPAADLPTSRAYPDNLFTLLGRRYAPHVQEPLTEVCPDALCGAPSRDPQSTRLSDLADDLGIVERRLLLPKSLADDLPAIDRDFAGFGEEADAPSSDDESARRVAGARAVQATLRPGGPKPGLWMVHHVIPHIPWRYEPDGTPYVVDGPSLPGIDDQTWGSNPFLLGQAWQRHFDMVGFADALLGEAIDRMQATGLWDDALVIVVADHGVAIGPGESRRPVTEENFAKVAGVPMFVKQPGQDRGARSPRFVTTMDVVPTIAKTLGIDAPYAFDGVPAGEDRVVDTLQQRNGREARLVSRTPAEFRAAFAAALAAQPAPGADPGPRPDLIGTDTAELEDTGGPGRATFNRDAAGGAYVTGWTEDVPAGTDLILAENGTIIASGEAYTDHGDPRFSFLLNGAVSGEVEVLSVDGRKVNLLGRARP